jgi:hypothetical protein
VSKVNLDIPLLYFKNRKLCFYGLSRIYLILSEVTESESSTIRKAPETLTANHPPATEPPSYYHFPGNKSFHTPESTLTEKPRSYFERHVNKFRIQSPKPGSRTTIFSADVVDRTYQREAKTQSITGMKPDSPQKIIGFLHSQNSVRR